MTTGMSEPSVVKGTVVVGDRGIAWVESDLTPEEQDQALDWLRRRHALGPGFSATVSWLRAKRVVGTICPRPGCRTLAERVTTVVTPDRTGKRGAISHAFRCPSCGRSWWVVRDATEDV